MIRNFQPGQPAALIRTPKCLLILAPTSENSAVMKWPFTLAVSKGVHIKSTDLLPHVPCSGQSNLYSLVVAMACHRDSLVLCLLVEHFTRQIHCAACFFS